MLASVLSVSPSAASAAGWSIQSIVPPPATTTDTSLSGVSCSAANACTAVGSYSTADDTKTLIERWDGVGWTLQTTPSAGRFSFLNAVSCPSATACIAVGYVGTATGFQTSALGWTGTQWKIEPTPNPAGATFSQLTAVSCTSATACTAVGDYSTSTGAALTLAERWNGATWIIQDTPNPSTTSNALGGVSCTSSTVCFATGSHEAYTSTTSLGTVPLAERWNGSGWSIQSIPSPPGANTSGVGNVSCTSASACTAVGAYTNNAGGATLAEYWNGASWSIETTANPVPGAFASLSGVSCPSALACTAVGAYTLGENTQVTLAERGSPTGSAILATPNPVGGAFDLLTAVSCTSQTACMAVGSYFNGDGAPTALLERYS